MSKRQVQIGIFPEFKAAVSSTLIRKVAIHALDAGKSARGYGVSVVIADDETLRELNRDHRGLNNITDVLAFESIGSGPDRDGVARGFNTNIPHFPEVPEQPKFLGEGIISYPQAERQASERGWIAERETALLVIHGILHLLGYDHEEEAEAQDMEALEGKVLAGIFS